MSKYFNYSSVTLYFILYTSVSHPSTATDHGLRLNVTIYDLTPATSYEVAIAANNMVGNSSYSRSVTMVTQEIGEMHTS